MTFRDRADSAGRHNRQMDVPPGERDIPCIQTDIKTSRTFTKQCVHGNGGGKAPADLTQEAAQRSCDPDQGPKPPRSPTTITPSPFSEEPGGPLSTSLTKGASDGPIKTPQIQELLGEAAAS